MRQRIAEELELLARAYAGAQHAEVAGEDWFLVPSYLLPEGWMIGTEAATSCPIAFKFAAAYPTSPPYGFAAPAGINFRGSAPGNPGSPVSPPFAGAWQHFSWAPEIWLPGSSARAGSNILTWVRGFKDRLQEGA